jgi:hypothetical protein
MHKHVVANYEMKYINSYKATQTGLYLVIFSALLFMTSGILIGVYLFNNYDVHIAFIPFVFIPLSLLIYWPFWSLILAKWKIWSFTRIDDIEILIKIAERKNLIYPDSHFYMKYEFCSKKDKIKIQELKKTKLSENNTNIQINLYKNKEYRVKSYFDILFSNDPLLVINYNGIWLREIGLIQWSNFSYLKLDFEKSIGYEGFREVWIDYKIQGEKEISRYDLSKISFMNINHFKIEYLLEVYKKLATTTYNQNC